jgi:hypothetical protein
VSFFELFEHGFVLVAEFDELCLMFLLALGDVSLLGVD